MLDYRGMTPNEALAVLDACAWTFGKPDMNTATLFTPAGFERFWRAYQMACDALVDLVEWRSPEADPPPLNKRVALRIGYEIRQGYRAGEDDYKISGLNLELHEFSAAELRGWCELPELKEGAPRSTS